MSIECWGSIDQDVDSVYWDVNRVLVKMFLKGIDQYFTTGAFSASILPSWKTKIFKFQFDQDRI